MEAFKEIKLTDVDICILVAKIQGHRVVSDSISHNLVPCDLNQRDSLIPVNSKGKHLTAFNPIENDALCYQLMLQHDIKVSKTKRGLYMAMYSHCRGEEDENPNKAICLAIIAANE